MNKIVPDHLARSAFVYVRGGMNGSRKSRVLKISFALRATYNMQARNWRARKQSLPSSRISALSAATTRALLTDRRREFGRR